MTNMHVGDDIHVELRGADGMVLATASSANATPATVTVFDESGVQLARSVRDEKAVTVFGRENQLIAILDADGGEPWHVADADGRIVGELLAGEPNPARKPGLAQWMLFTDLALNTAAHQRDQHLGIQKVMRYSYAPLGTAPVSVALALLPLLAGLTY